MVDGKFEKMARDAMDVCLRVLKKATKRHEPMDSFVNSLTANNLELTLPYLNDLVDYNSELDYNPTASSPGRTTETTPLDISRKLPTRLSKNPSSYEKELRQLVLKLYSDKELSDQEEGSSTLNMLHSINSPSYIRVITPQVPDEGSVFEETDGPADYGPQVVSAPQPLNMMRMKEPPQTLLETRSEGYCSMDSGVAPPEKTRIQSLSELQGYLMNFHNSTTDVEPSRTLSVSDPGLLTPVFDDSGIHLEFAVSDTDASDVETEEPGGEGGTGGREQPIEHRKLHHVMADLRSRPCLVIREDTSAFVQSTSAVQDRDPEVSVTNGFETTDNGWEEFLNPKNSRSFDLIVNMNGARPESLLLEEETDMSGNCQELSLKRACLEGKLELLQEEFSSVLDDRKSLQIRLQAVETRLKEEGLKARQSKPTEITLVDELKRNKTDLETKLASLYSAYEEKQSSLRDAFEQLKTSEVTIQHLKEHLSLVEGEIDQREEMVSSLQTEMENLKRLLDEAKEQNENFRKENQALNSDISSLVKAKDWLQKQLSLTQDARTKLQLRTSEYESTLAGKNQVIEELRCESARTSQQLTELQQNSLFEKAEVLKHLERVEENIAQQNLALKETEIESRNVEQTMCAKVESLTNENEKLVQLMSSAVEMGQDLEAAKQDVILKEALLEAIVRDKEDITEQLRLARESTQEYKRSLDELGVKFQETKEELKVAQENTEAKECYIEKLEEEKRMLESNLESANKERMACDGAIHSLRLDLEKVDRRFKLMKRELAAKSCQLEETKQQKDGFVVELRALREGFENQLAKSNALREEFAHKERLIEGFQEVRDGLQNEIVALTQQLSSSRDEIARVDEERNTIQEQLQSALREIVQLEAKFHKSLLERARLEGELETTQKTNRDEMNTLRNQNVLLKEERKSEQVHLQRDLMKERDKAINLQQELKFVTDEMARKTVEYNNKVQTMSETLQEEKNGKQTVEEELRKRHEINEQRIEELQKKHDSQLKRAQNDLLVVQQSKDQAEQELVAFRVNSASQAQAQNHEMKKVERELSFLKKTLKQRKAEVEKMQMCAIELEREKGRLAGVLASQKTLRDHVVRMEKEVATREAALIERTSEAEGLRREMELQQKTASEKVIKLETQAREQSRRNQELQDSLGKQRRENHTLRREQDEERRKREEMDKKLGLAEKETQRLRGEVSREYSDARRWRSQLESSKKSLEEEKVLSSQLQRRLDELEEQNKAKEDQMESLEWEADQRHKEVDYMKEQLRMVEERQQLELENLKTALQVSRSETTSLRSDLSEARKAKCVYQTQTFELKDSVLTARQLTEKLKQDLFVKRQDLVSLQNNVLSAKSLQMLQEDVRTTRDVEPERDEADGIQTLRKVSSNTSRPVSSLQDCMSSLRSQIGTLQKQINDHADFVQTTTTSWRSFKENVHELQASCTSPNSKQLKAEKDFN